MTSRFHLQKGRTIVLVVLLALLALVLLNQHAIGDWVRLRGYTPAPAVSALTTTDTFTPEATHLFYINRPQIVAKQRFSQVCASKAEQTIVLGCYHGVQNGIYVLKIADDSRLNGVMQVTAAHEMLHAAYDRLPDSQRQQVDGWLQDYYNHGLQDARIKKTIDAYKQTEPDALVNEMHSIFGTEVSSLPPQLETYYKQYFTDRQKVVSLADNYQKEFISREQQVAAYDAQLKTLKQTITTNEATLNTQAASLNAEAQTMQQLKASGQITAYNAKVDNFNSRITAYNALVATTKDDISQYNDIVAKRNAIAIEQQQLTKELSGDGITDIH